MEFIVSQTVLVIWSHTRYAIHSHHCLDGIDVYLDTVWTMCSMETVLRQYWCHIGCWDFMYAILASLKQPGSVSSHLSWCINGWTKWPIFCIWHFEMYFLERKRIHSQWWLALGQTGDKPFPEPMLTQICDPMWCHKVISIWIYLISIWIPIIKISFILEIPPYWERWSLYWNMALAAMS